MEVCVCVCVCVVVVVSVVVVVVVLVVVLSVAVSVVVPPHRMDLFALLPCVLRVHAVLKRLHHVSL